MTRRNCSPPGSSVPGQGCWSGLPCPAPGDLRNPGTEASSFMSPALAGWFFTTITTWETTHWRRWNRPNRTRVVQAKDSALGKHSEELQWSSRGFNPTLSSLFGTTQRPFSVFLFFLFCLLVSAHIQTL